MLSERQDSKMLDFTCDECGHTQIIRPSSRRFFEPGLCDECRVGPKSNKYKSLYFKWFQIKQRCHDENYKDYHMYGGRGVKMCDEWLNDKQAFYTWCLANGYDKDLDLDKDIGSRRLGIEPPIYSPETCTFVPNMTNAKATRKIVSTNTTGYRGVSFNKTKGYYVATIMNDKKPIHLKYSKYAIKCAMAYDKWIEDNKSEHTPNNIPKSAIESYYLMLDYQKRIKEDRTNLRQHRIKLKKYIEEMNKVTADLESKLQTDEEIEKYHASRI